MSRPEIPNLELGDGREVEFEYVGGMEEVRSEYSASWPVDMNYSEAVQQFDADESVGRGSHTHIIYDSESESLEDVMRNEQRNPWFIARERLRDSEREFRIDLLFFLQMESTPLNGGRKMTQTTFN